MEAKAKRAFGLGTHTKLKIERGFKVRGVVFRCFNHAQYTVTCMN